MGVDGRVLGEYVVDPDPLAVGVVPSVEDVSVALDTGERGRQRPVCVGPHGIGGRGRTVPGHADVEGHEISLPFRIRPVRGR